MKVIIASGKPKPSLLANLLNKFQASHRSRYILTQQIPIHNMQYKRIKHISCSYSSCMRRLEVRSYSFSYGTNPLGEQLGLYRSFLYCKDVEEYINIVIYY